MILFLNFAPIEFMGGAEKWMYETARLVNKKESTTLMSVSPQIANIYSLIVLKRKYDSRVTSLSGTNLVSLSFSSFFPFTSAYWNTVERFKTARKIYLRYEVLEMLILIYFGGVHSFKKTICGVHFPLVYPKPKTYLQKFHNLIYMSQLSKWSLQKLNMVHVITPRDEKLLSQTMDVKNVVYIPTSTNMKVTSLPADNKSQKIDILFVGELSSRKGCDILLSVINKSPNTMKFLIAGNGEMRHSIEKMSKKNENVTYFGYLTGTSLSNLYKKADALFLPSRAEGFPLVFHEAMINGLVIIDSPESKIGLPENIELTASDSDPETYVDLFESLLKSKPEKSVVHRFYKDNFSKEIIDEKLENFLFA